MPWVLCTHSQAPWLAKTDLNSRISSVNWYNHLERRVQQSVNDSFWCIFNQRFNSIVVPSKTHNTLIAACRGRKTPHYAVGPINRQCKVWVLLSFPVFLLQNIQFSCCKIYRSLEMDELSTGQILPFHITSDMGWVFPNLAALYKIHIKILVLQRQNISSTLFI